MIHFHSIAEVSLRDAWLAVGVFDGVHRGHQEILRRLTKGAHAVHAPAAVITFDPHPASVLGHQEVKCLTLPDERAQLLGSLGVDVVITYPFDRTVANTSALDFIRGVKQHLDLKHLLMGYDFALGKGREGNARRLAEIGRELGYEVEVVEAVSDESGVISSTEIRKLVSLGDVAEASRLLGHAYSLHGPVVHGDGRGKRIQTPTANIEYPPQKIIPANGVYACWAYVDQEKVRALTNVGINPTFTPDKSKPSVEAYLLDFDRDLYGQDLKVEFVERLRDEIRFSSVEALLAQIKVDIDQGRALLV